MANAIESVPQPACTQTHTHVAHTKQRANHDPTKTEISLFHKFRGRLYFHFLRCRFGLHCKNRWTTTAFHKCVMGAELYGFAITAATATDATNTDRRHPLSCVQTICSS